MNKMVFVWDTIFKIFISIKKIHKILMVSLLQNVFKKPQIKLKILLLEPELAFLGTIAMILQTLFQIDRLFQCPSG